MCANQLPPAIHEERVTPFTDRRPQSSRLAPWLRCETTQHLRVGHAAAPVRALAKATLVSLELRDSTPTARPAAKQHLYRTDAPG